MKKERFIAVKKDENGNFTAFKSNTGKTYNYEMAKEVILQDLIENAEVVNDSKGEPYIRAKVDKNKRLKPLDQ